MTTATETKVTINGIELDFNLGSGALGWSSDWANVHKLASAGFLKAVHHGRSTYGAVSYFLTARGRQAAV